MFRLLVVLALLSCVYGLPRSKHHVAKKHGQKIVGGEETTIEKHPYQVALFSIENLRQKFRCGGSIISDQWILTAAHCMHHIETILIRAGSSYLYTKGTTYTTTKYILHPNYDFRSLDNDVALINVPGGMKLNNKTMKAVMLAPSNTSVAAGTKTIVSGWGHTMIGGHPTVELRSVQVPIVSHSNCSRAYKLEDKKITDNMICAGGIEGFDFCQGDDGGTQVLESGEQVGVVSFGELCGYYYYPGVYAKVANMRPWIKEVTGV